jgi:hypothetical protein
VPSVSSSKCYETATESALEIEIKYRNTILVSYVGTDPRDGECGVHWHSPLSVSIRPDQIMHIHWHPPA